MYTIIVAALYREADHIVVTPSVKNSVHFPAVSAEQRVVIAPCKDSLTGLFHECHAYYDYFDYHTSHA